MSARADTLNYALLITDKKQPSSFLEGYFAAGAAKTVSSIQL